jgi:hypothetical protein
MYHAFVYLNNSEFCITITTVNFQKHKSVASFCGQVAVWVPDMFATVIFLNNPTTTEGRKNKHRSGICSAFENFWCNYGQIKKTHQILLNSRWFQVTTKQFTGQNIPILTWMNSPHIINLLTFPFSGWHLSLVWRHYRQSVQAFNSWSQCYKNFFLRCQWSSCLFSLICNLTVRSTHRYLSEVDCSRHISW